MARLVLMQYIFTKEILSARKMSRKTEYTLITEVKWHFSTLLKGRPSLVCTLTFEARLDEGIISAFASLCCQEVLWR